MEAHSIRNGLGVYYSKVWFVKDLGFFGGLDE
jgi:hypothetical protein